MQATPLARAPRPNFPRHLPPPSSHVVTATGASFSPVTITIAQGASVTWQIVGNTHNVTFGTNKPTGGDAPNATPGSTVTRTFATADPYPYECTLQSGMVGTVVVQGATAPVFTSVAVTPAPPGVNVGATAQLTAAARDQDGSAMAGYPAATWASGNAASRTFATLGTYDHQCSRHSGMTGQVVVTWEFSGGSLGIVFEDAAAGRQHSRELARVARVPYLPHRGGL